MTDNQMMQVMKMRKLVNQRGFGSLKLLPPYLTLQWLQKADDEDDWELWVWLIWFAKLVQGGGLAMVQAKTWW